MCLKQSLSTSLYIKYAKVNNYMFDSYFYFKLLHFQKSILNEGFCFVLFANFLGLVVLKKKKRETGTCLEVQWLMLCTSTAGGTDSVPGQDTEHPSAVRCSQN